MEINFERFEMPEGLVKKGFKEMNVKEAFADGLYRNGVGVACHALAMKIYNSEGSTEYTDKEYRIMLEYAEACCTPRVIDAIRNLKKEEDGKC